MADFQNNFQNVYRYNVSLCPSVVLPDVSEHNSNPVGENELCFVVGTCVFLFFSGMIQDSRVLPSELRRGKKMWILVAGFSDEMWMLQKPKEEIVAFFSKKKISKPSDKTSSTTASSATMFLVGMICTQTSAHWHLKIPIKLYGSIYFVSLVEKKCTSIWPEKATKNSIQMVNATGETSIKLIKDVHAKVF